MCHRPPQWTLLLASVQSLSSSNHTACKIVRAHHPLSFRCTSERQRTRLNFVLYHSQYPTVSPHPSEISSFRAFQSYFWSIIESDMGYHIEEQGGRSLLPLPSHSPHVRLSHSSSPQAKWPVLILEIVSHQLLQTICTLKLITSFAGCATSSNPSYLV